jgi:RHS repeat-associated protein
MMGAQGYEPFGSLLPGRNYSASSYRFGFQGQEKDDEIHGATGTSYAFEYRMHDPRVGRFLSIDPLAAKYPWNSPYAFAENKVIKFIELEGLETSINYGDLQSGMAATYPQTSFTRSSLKKTVS